MKELGRPDFRKSSISVGIVLPGSFPISLSHRERIGHFKAVELIAAVSGHKVNRYTPLHQDRLLAGKICEPNEKTAPLVSV